MRAGETPIRHDGDTLTPTSLSFSPHRPATRRLLAATSTAAAAAFCASTLTTYPALADAAPEAAAEIDVYAPPSPVPPLPSTPITLYQYEVCPFCCKVKAVLDYYGVPYRVIEVSPLTKRQLKAGAPGHTKVPVALIDGETLADSSAIISRIAASAKAAGKGGKGDANASSPPSRGGWLRGARGPAAADADKDTAWRRWVDGRLVKVVTINIYSTGREAWQTFDYITSAGDFGGIVEKTASRVVGAGMMYAIGGRLAKKYGITQPPRDALASVATEWVEGALDGGEYAGGATPSLADLSAFGVWRAVKGTDTFTEAMAGAPALAAWYGRMEGAVGPSARVEG